MSDLMKNGNFLGQSYTILAGLNKYVEAIGSKINLVREVNHLGAAHLKRGVTPVMFEMYMFINQIFDNKINFLNLANEPDHHLSSRRRNG